MIEAVLYKCFFTLLKSGLWNIKLDLSYFPLDDKDWEKIYSWARMQTVEAIVHDGVMQLPDKLLPPKLLLMRWTVQVDFIERQNKQMYACMEELADSFSEQHIEFFLLKGQGVSACYDVPLHRVSGDIDWFFPTASDFNRACRLIDSKGIRMVRQTRFSIAYKWKGVLVEHHKYMLDIHNPLVASFLKNLQKSEQSNAIFLNTRGKHIKMPSPLLNHLCVNAHILKHLLMFGIGLRQICDSARICKAYYGRVDGQKLQKAYKKAGLYSWMQQFNHLLVSDLGMPVNYLPFPLETRNNSHWILQEVLESGNFGFYSEHTAFKWGHRWRKRLYGLLHLVKYTRYVPLEVFSYLGVLIYSRIKNELVS